MDKNQVIIVIPARMASTRLPNKPLADIAGKPMICHVHDQARATGLDVVVACDDERIKAVIEAQGGNSVMTSPDHASGTDRIYEAIQDTDYEYIINVQGDLPTIEPDLIVESLRPFKQGMICDISTLVTPIIEAAEITNPNVVKPVITWDDTQKLGHAHYFSRAAIPYNAKSYYHHIGLYCYDRMALKRFVSLKPSPLEQAEKLEQLRAIEAGMEIAVVNVDTFPLGIDTSEDLTKAREILS